MFSRLRAALSWVPTVLVLAGLLALGVWGAKTDWKLSHMFPRFFREPEAEKKKSADEPDNPNVSPGNVVLASPDAAEHAGVESDAVKRQALTRYVEAPAVLAFDQTRYAHLSPRAQGTAWRVLGQFGDTVRKDDVLALITSADVGKAKAEFLTALVQHDVKDRTMTRIRSASGFIADQRYYDAQLALREARVQLVNAQQMLVNLGLPLKLDALKNLTDDQIALKIRSLGMPVDVANQDDVPASLLPIVAPFDGLILRRDLVVGEVTSPDKPAFVVADVSRLWVLLDVRLEDVDRLVVGQPVTFESSATGQGAEGVLKWISPEVDVKTRTVKVRAEVYNPAGKLRPATFGKLRIHVQQQSNALTVPTGALQWDGQGRRVFVCRDNKTFEPRLVLAGLTSNGRTELLDPRLMLASVVGRSPIEAMLWLPTAESVLVPMQAGDKVATSGSHVLKSEMLKSRIAGDD